MKAFNLSLCFSSIITRQKVLLNEGVIWLLDQGINSLPCSSHYGNWTRCLLSLDVGASRNEMTLSAAKTSGLCHLD